MGKNCRCDEVEHYGHLDYCAKCGMRVTAVFNKDFSKMTWRHRRAQPIKTSAPQGADTGGGE